MSRQGSSTPLAALFACLLLSFHALAAPISFEAAKAQARQLVYHDRTQHGTFYCGCPWEWTGRSGGRVDLKACGYEIRAQQNRAIRIEWEHIVPASSFGQQRQCWQQGGRKHCNQTDPVFNRMEADLHNLTPAIGEVNADRSNYRFGLLHQTPYQHGRCDFKVDFPGRVAQPREAVRGQIARIYFYMHDRYDMRMSEQQQKLMMAWDAQFPPSAWERERNTRITRVMGHPNEFVTGQRSWSLGHRNTADGVAGGTRSATTGAPTAPSAPVMGNSRSKVYHLPTGCPSYGAVSTANQVSFPSAAEAEAAGYRLAGNCR
jgi:deoxyribonuclease I